MAVVTLYGSAAYDPSVLPRQPKNAQFTSGHINNLCSTTEVANGNSATSKILAGTIPASASIKRASRIYADAIAGLTDLDVGLGKAGVVKSANCLLDGWDAHSGGVSNLTGIDYADLGKKAAWELAGYTENPGGDLEIWITINTDLTAAGTITADIDFALP